jgi:catechol 2,3-dioxygenase-like lactoylglutathione lyase family enzyme
MTRRETLKVLSAGALAATRLSAADRPSFHALDHVGLTVSDAKKAASFYARVFGPTVYKETMNDRRYVKAGPCYLAMAPPGANQSSNYRVDHICPGVEPYDIPSLETYLKEQNVTFRHTDDFGPFIPDPNGINVQWWMWSSWVPTIKTSAPEPQPLAGEPIFEATGIDHILIQTADLAKSVSFYEKLFGPVSQRTGTRTWFKVGPSRVGLSTVAAGQSPGVNHVCFNVASLDRVAGSRKLEQAGAKIQPGEAPNDLQFRDPDGILFQIQTAAV